MTPDPIRYAIYTRQSVSSAEKTLSSCDAQFSICQDFAKARSGPGWNWIGERLDDEGASGADADRLALQRLLRLVREHQVEKVIIYRLDRLTRSLRDSLNILDTFREANVELLIATSPELGSAATDNFLLNLMASFAEFEHDMIRSRLSDARQALKRRGRRIAGRVPYGYDTDPNTKQLIVNYDEARRVEAMFQMAADGMLPRDIAQTANDEGWRTKVTIAKRTGRKSGGNLWTPRQVLNILSNPVYLGLFKDGNHTRMGKHLRIVARELYDLAQSQIQARRTTKQKTRKSRLQWPLRRKIVCTRCGRLMSPHVTHNGNRRYRHYRCRSHAGGRPPCKGSALPAYEIESHVAEWLADYGLLGEVSNLSDDQRRLLERFQVVWRAMNEVAQSRALPEVVERVEFDEGKSALSVTFDLDGIERLAQPG